MLIRIKTWEKIFNGEIDIKKYILDNNLTPDEYDPEYDLSKLPFISLIIYKLNYKNLLEFVNKTFTYIQNKLNKCIILLFMLTSKIINKNLLKNKLKYYNTYISKEFIVIKEILVLLSLI